MKNLGEIMMMLSFNNNKALKQKFVDRAIWHREQDKYVQGQGKYDPEQKGCSVACSFGYYDHARAAKEIQVPEWIIRTQDKIFEALPKKDADLWTERFFDAIPEGKDLTGLLGPWLVIILERVLDRIDLKNFPECKKVVERVRDLYKSGETDLNKYRDAARAAYAACAAYAAYAAAHAAYAAYAAYAAADAAYAADAAADTWQYFADKFIELLKSAGGLET